MTLPEQIGGDLRAGNLQVRLAETPEEIALAQRLRYQIFFGELGGAPDAAAKASGIDSDAFDAHCDHLLVLEHADTSAPIIVGTYRLLRRSRMRALGRFYTASEFDISAVEAHPGEILELGRSCVDENYRNRAVMQLLWRGIGAYVALHDIQLMFGCASFPGVDPSAHADALSYLHHFHLAPPEMRLKALTERYTPMDLRAESEIDEKRAFGELPPLIKGYLRLGGYVGEGAVIDPDCRTVDVGIVVKTALVTDKYVQRYGGQQENG